MPLRLPRIFRLPRATQPGDVQPSSRIQGVDEAWFSPLQPIQPFAPAGTKPRQFNYELGQNVMYTPRAERIPFQTLRQLADTWSLLRLVIETAKDQVLRVEYDIGPRPKLGDKPPRTADPNVAAIKSFLAYPDGIHSFREWLRMLLEDLFVIDAAVVYFERDLQGRIASLRQLDGATITRLIDARGVTPAPPQPAYQQLVWEVPSQNFTLDDLQYGMMYERACHLYGFSPVEQLLLTINQGLRRDVMRLGYYSAGNMPEMLVMVQDAPMDKIERYQQYFNSMLSGNLQRRNQAIFLPSAGSGKDQVILPKQDVLKDEYDDFLIRLVCYAFSVSPSALQKPMNRASAETVSSTSEEEGLLPKLLWLEDYLNRIIQVRLGFTNYEFHWRTTRDTDELKQAQTDKIYVDSGVKTRNELRADLGLDPVDVEEADMLGITTAQGFVPLAPEPAPAPSPAHKASTAAETVLAAVLASAFHDAFARISSVLRKDDQLTPEERAALLAKALAELEITWDSLPRVSEPLLAEAALKGVSDGTASVGAFVGFRAVQDQARAYAKERAAEMVGKKWVSGQLVDNPDARYAISSTTRQELRRIFSEEANLSPAAFIQAIQEAGLFTESRARLIAQTELKNIGQRSQLEAWKRSGRVEALKWNLSSIGVHCPACIENAAAPPVAIGQAFPSGDEAPAAHPQCRCYLTIASFKKTRGFTGKRHTEATRRRISETMRARNKKDDSGI